MTLEGKKKGTVLKEFARGTRSELETAPHQPAEMSSGVFPGQRRMGVIRSLNTDILGNI